MGTKGKCLIFSAPSGSGKTTIVHHVVAARQDVTFSISATTRSPRKNEVHGKDYYFLTRSEFEKKIRDEEFLEWEEVYEGLYYGTLKSEVDRIHSEGHHVIFDVDVAGGSNLKKRFGGQSLAIFIKVDDLDKLRYRLSKRGTESPKAIELRMSKVREELKFEKYFDISVVNNDLNETLDEIDRIVSNYLADKS